MTYKDITNNERVQNVSVDIAGNGLNLYYELDNTPSNVTGEFFIDKQSVLHHIAIDANDNEVEILVKLEF